MLDEADGTELDDYEMLVETSSILILLQQRPVLDSSRGIHPEFERCVPPEPLTATSTVGPGVTSASATAEPLESAQSNPSAQTSIVPAKLHFLCSSCEGHPRPSDHYSCSRD